MAHLARCLVVDEHLSVGKNEFRCRLWYSKGKSPVCVLSQVPGGPAPDVCSGRLANLVISTLAGFRQPLPTFYETSYIDGLTRCFRVVYERIGCIHRPILINPAYQPMSTTEFTCALMVSTGSGDLF